MKNSAPMYSKTRFASSLHFLNLFILDIQVNQHYSSIINDPLGLLGLKICIIYKQSVFKKRCHKKYKEVKTTCQ